MPIAGVRSELPSLGCWPKVSDQSHPGTRGSIFIPTIALAMIFQEIIFLIFTGDNLKLNSQIDGFF